MNLIETNLVILSEISKKKFFFSFFLPFLLEQIN